MVLTATTDVVKLQPENVPAELRQLVRWCVWRREPDKKDSATLTKKPMQASWPSRAFSKTTAAQYRSFDVAVKAYEQYHGSERSPVDGIGLVCGGGVVGIDFDECCDEVTREVRSDVAEWLERLNTYAEFSPSGRGVRAFVRGSLPDRSTNSRPAGVELYDEPNYVTVTGFQVPGTPEHLAEGGAVLAELYAFAKAKMAEAKEERAAAKQAERGRTAKQAATGLRRTANQDSTRVHTPSAGGGLSDAELVELAERSPACGAAVSKLLGGDCSGYASQSEAEMALANYLAFYAGRGGEAQVERLIRSSGMKRAKHDENAEYLSRTVARAFEERDEFYAGKAATGKKKKEAAPISLPNGIPSTGPADLNDDSTLTDVGLARRLVLEAKDTLRYVKEWGSWLSWSGRHWEQDNGLVAAHIGKRVSDKLWREYAELPEWLRKKPNVLGFVRSAASSRTIEAAVRLARSEPQVIVSAAELDRHPYLLNLGNCTLDLLTTEARPHSPADLLTHLAGTVFDETAHCPTWRRFVADVTNGDAELAGFLQRSCGLALSGDVSEQKLWLHYGEGRNGKSTMLNVLTELLGTYAGPAPLEMLLVRRNQAKEAETQFASLAGKRLVTTVEADSGVRFSEATVKLLTGGDVVLARRLYEDAWPVRPSWKLHVAANHKPVVRGTDEGIWRRVLLTPWLRRFEGEAEDRQLKEKLLAELPGILNWCVFGFSQWRDMGGLRPPKSVLAATQEYRGENDVLGMWLEECCVKQANAVSEAAALYRSYRDWCEDRGEFAVTATAFGTQLERLGFLHDRPSAGQWRNRTIRRGLGLLSGREGEL